MCMDLMVLLFMTDQDVNLACCELLVLSACIISESIEQSLLLKLGLKEMP